MTKLTRLAFPAVVCTLLTATAFADPCGMVPPIPTGPGPHRPIARVGVQQTYVFYHKGYQSIVIRPGFKGGVSEFGMLIPFPTPPAMRKVPENIFDHVAAAVDPPEVLVQLGFWGGGFGGGGFGGGGLGGGGGGFGGGLGVQLRPDEVKVLKEEAVGMYEVAVLAAGSAKALNLWMKDHGFRYPAGMDAVCNDYVKMRWCFVAVKAKVAVKKRVNPQPGQRAVDTDLPKDATFDGHVQAMGFRFRSPKLVVPMRLSAFNKGSLRNIVYLLADTPASIRGIPAKYVRRQIPGRLLYRNLTSLLPLRVQGAAGVTKRGIKKPGGGYLKLSDYKAQRDPRPKNGYAADLFVADLTAVKNEQLALSFETKEKSLTNIAERLGLRDPSIDKLNRKVSQADRERALNGNRKLLGGMTLTVIDGDFSREFIAANNLTFRRFLMPRTLNNRTRYNANQLGPSGRQYGLLISGTQIPDATQPTASQTPKSQTARWTTVLTSMFVVGFAMIIIRRRRGVFQTARE